MNTIKKIVKGAKRVVKDAFEIEDQNPKEDTADETENSDDEFVDAVDDSNNDTSNELTGWRKVLHDIVPTTYEHYYGDVEPKILRNYDVSKMDTWGYTASVNKYIVKLRDINDTDSSDFNIEEAVLKILIWGTDIKENKNEFYILLEAFFIYCLNAGVTNETGDFVVHPIRKEIKNAMHFLIRVFGISLAGKSNEKISVQLAYCAGSYSNIDYTKCIEYSNKTTKQSYPTATYQAGFWVDLLVDSVKYESLDFVDYNFLSDYHEIYIQYLLGGYFGNRVGLNCKPIYLPPYLTFLTKTIQNYDSGFKSLKAEVDDFSKAFGGACHSLKHIPDYESLKKNYADKFEESYANRYTIISLRIYKLIFYSKMTGVDKVEFKYIEGDTKTDITNYLLSRSLDFIFGLIDYNTYNTIKSTLNADNKTLFDTYTSRCIRHYIRYYNKVYSSTIDDVYTNSSSSEYFDNNFKSNPIDFENIKAFKEFNPIVTNITDSTNKSIENLTFKAKVDYVLALGSRGLVCDLYTTYLTELNTLLDTKIDDKFVLPIIENENGRKDLGMTEVDAIQIRWLSGGNWYPPDTSKLHFLRRNIWVLGNYFVDHALNSNEESKGTLRVLLNTQRYYNYGVTERSYTDMKTKLFGISNNYVNLLYANSSTEIPSDKIQILIEAISVDDKLTYHEIVYYICRNIIGKTIVGDTNFAENSKAMIDISKPITQAILNTTKTYEMFILFEFGYMDTPTFKVKLDEYKKPRVSFKETDESKPDGETPPVPSPPTPPPVPSPPASPPVPTPPASLPVPTVIKSYYTDLINVNVVEVIPTKTFDYSSLLSLPETKATTPKVTPNYSSMLNLTSVIEVTTTTPVVNYSNLHYLLSI